MSVHKLPMLRWLNCKFVKRALLTRGATPGTPEGGEA
jgi:hypothetical protein